MKQLISKYIVKKHLALYRGKIKELPDYLLYSEHLVNSGIIIINVPKGKVLRYITSRYHSETKQIFLQDDVYNALWVHLKKSICQRIRDKREQKKMNTLYIIGNGFDCYCHRMKTQYKDFRNYLLENYPDSEEFYRVPMPTLTADHHDYDYAEEDIVGFIVHILDNCQGDDWSELETALGGDVFDVFEDEFEEVDLDNEDDNEIYNNIEQNIENGSAIGAVFDRVKELFIDWVNEKLAEIEYDTVSCNPDYKLVLRNNVNESEYINFNYTYTLEKVYGIDSDKVWHIHGQVGDSSEKIMFGHGKKKLKFNEKLGWGETDSFGDLAKKLMKDTESVITNNRARFAGMKDVEKIFSAGFSFSEVDMVYIDELCRYINPQSVVWYFNSYDAANNPSYIKKIKARGFQVNIENRW